jgi:hypothetical protein
MCLLLTAKLLAGYSTPSRATLMARDDDVEVDVLIGSASGIRHRPMILDRIACYEVVAESVVALGSAGRQSSA